MIGVKRAAAQRETIERSNADVVVAATPVDLARILGAGKPVVRVRYEFADLDHPGLRGEVERFLSGRAA